MVQALTHPSSAKLPPLDHPLADIIYRLEAGGALIPDTPVNLLQATRAAFYYPLDDPNPEHLMANRRFFVAQMDRFLRPQYGIAEACKIRNVQDPNYL